MSVAPSLTKAEEAYVKMMSILSKYCIITNTAYHSYSTERRDWSETTDKTTLTLNDRTSADILQAIHDWAEEKSSEDRRRGLAERTSDLGGRENLTEAVAGVVLLGFSAGSITEAIQDGVDRARRTPGYCEGHQIPLLRALAVVEERDLEPGPKLEWSKDLEWHSGHPFRAITRDFITLELIEYVPPASVLGNAQICVEATWQGGEPNHPSFCRRVSGSRVEVLVDGLLVQARAHINMVTDELKRREERKA
jgi:flavin-binding protein dodecin